MTRIDFHSNVPDKLLYACRLTRKAYLASNRIVLLAGDAAQLAELNARLWTFSATDFLPHVAADDALAAVTPIIVGDDDGAEWPHYDILINLSQRSPAGFGRFARLIELVGTEADDVASGRQRYLAYKQQDYQPTHFVAGKS
jgi:DNA polymerase-3 subunit chi